MKLCSLLFVAVFCGAVLGQDKLETENQTVNEVEDDGNWKVLYRLITDCSKTSDISVCLKMKVVTFLDRMASLRAPLLINDYVSLTRDPAYKEGPQGRSMKPLSEAQLEESLPRSIEERSSRLDEMIQDKLDDFLQSRNLQMSIPADVFEGRRRKRKGGALLLAAGTAMAAMMAQVFMGKVALIAGKALLVAKVALVLSAIIGLKKLFGSSGSGESHQVVYATGGHEHGGWQGRGFTSENSQAHDIAYKAQKPENTGDE